MGYGHSQRVCLSHYSLNTITYNPTVLCVFFNLPHDQLPLIHSLHHTSVLQLLGVNILHWIVLVVSICAIVTATLDLALKMHWTTNCIASIFVTGDRETCSGWHRNMGTNQLPARLSFLSLSLAFWLYIGRIQANLPTSSLMIPITPFYCHHDHWQRHHNRHHPMYYFLGRLFPDWNITLPMLPLIFSLPKVCIYLEMMMLMQSTNHYDWRLPGWANHNMSLIFGYKLLLSVGHSAQCCPMSMVHNEKLAYCTQYIHAWTCTHYETCWKKLFFNARFEFFLNTSCILTIDFAFVG